MKEAFKETATAVAIMLGVLSVILLLLGLPAKADAIDQRREEIRALQDQANALKDIARSLDRVANDCRK